MLKLGRKPKSKLPVTEELDFQYLLELMPSLHDIPNFSWLPELFTIIGHEDLIRLCKYAGGHTIRIPTLQELSDSVDALQWYYDVEISHTKNIVEVPICVLPLFTKIKEIYDNVNNN